ncbi:MAG: hypothetical protein GX051_08420 [Clostridiales bacterium]|nr:hypothetical protein [Clostridiales bacterium]
MLFYGIFFAAAIVEIVFVPWFIKVMWPARSRKSLILKMICATAFVVMGVAAVLISGDWSRFAVLMLCGLVMSWFGDYFLHAKNCVAFFAAGLLCFMGGHIFYICAYSSAIRKLFPGSAFFDKYELVAIAVIFSIGVAYAIIKKMTFGGVLWAAVGVYAIVLTTMLVKAWTFALRYFSASLENAPAVLVMLCLGSLLFFMSDCTLAIILFGGKRGHYPIKIFNLVTYFLGQMFLAASMIFVAA